MAKYIFVTGGVLSSLGKGITAASLGALLESRGYKVRLKKFDPYLNYGPGTMSPLQHGEIFVTDDGSEGDLDLGHYERFTTSNTDKHSDLTSGKIYYTVIERERRGEYLGATVQVIPHITDEIKSCICAGTENYDIAIVEIGGTVGDIEGLPFLEAIRQMKFDNDESDVIFVHVTLVPYIKSAGELKTKPTQHSVRQLQEIGISPDILVCRSEYPLSDGIRRKLALFCNVDEKAVINCMDAATIYQVPLILNEERLDSVILEKLNLEERSYDLTKWQDIVRRIKQPKDAVKIAVVGKYLETKDAYISLTEALLHGAVANYLKADLKWIDAELLEEKMASEYLSDTDGILIPAGFGERGVEGKIAAVNFARTKDIPFFGISLGMHAAVIEYARNVLKLSDARSAEMTKPENSANLVIDYRHDEHYSDEMGATMRLGSFVTHLEKDSLVREIYGSDSVKERHRHRLELNNRYREAFENSGMKISGNNLDTGFADVVELSSHRWFVGCQFCPEFQSKPFSPHPLFSAFLQAAHKFKLAKNNINAE
ncbi:MAG: CTP synthase [Mucispirillum sp.]|nr:CTP synthase [Mucispirillum sp.]